MIFREVYDAHLPFVWRSLRRLGVADSHLKDAVQEVFLIVHRRLPDFVESAKVTTWLFRICMGVARDQRRRAHVRREVLDGSELESHADTSADVTGALEQRESLAIFEAALAHMNEEQRAVFVLFELEDMTGEQIAEALLIPLGTVYSRLRLGRAAFKKGVQRELSRRSGPAVGTA